MTSRRVFLKTSGAFALGTLLLPTISEAAKVKNVGIQLYTVRKEMLADARGTLKALAKMGYKEIESARSEKGHYYGFTGAEMKKVTKDLGLILRSGHVHVNENWQKTVDEAAEAGQTYLICSSLPSRGQTISNYQQVAETFNKAAEACKKANLIFGYHNHEYEFDKVDGKILYDILLDETDPDLVKMEMDLGWAIVTGNDPMRYFQKYPNRFPLWHLKDMKKEKEESTEFGNGRINFVELFQAAKKSGMKHFFVEQEEYAGDPMDSVKHNINYLKKLNY
ncbi:sugar phosphate isomerase/epimerase family protein [Adhaeribacter aquaticus]|uniref:sugar phosphate isomerase/epimerase family protein n=1 Tax=Adhaeribacter aquaticus TaxID=299567 RepID=UPI0003F88FF1|nr:sugar phosphate isomerase/epimerase [Adhaeribacter aquaticus]